MSEVCTLRIWLAAPMQSWGTASRFEVRATELAPSKSGVIGLVCAALGRPRSEPVDDLAALRFGVRVEQPGSVLRDFHTVGAGTDPVAVASGARGRGIVTERYYLEDGAFVAALEGSDRALLEQCRTALAAPRWLLSLGRRSCPPAGPLVDDAALFDGSLAAALRDDWRPRGVAKSIGGGRPSTEPRIELLVEAKGGALVLHDQPRGSSYETRSFGPRRFRSEWIGGDAS